MEQNAMLFCLSLDGEMKHYCLTFRPRPSKLQWKHCLHSLSPDPVATIYPRDF